MSCSHRRARAADMSRCKMTPTVASFQRPMVPTWSFRGVRFDAKWTQLWAIEVENDPWGGKVDVVAWWHARVTGLGAEKRSIVSQCRAGMRSQTLVFPQRGSFFQRGNENEKNMMKSRDSWKSFRKTTTTKGRQGRKRYKKPS